VFDGVFNLGIPGNYTVRAIAVVPDIADSRVTTALYQVLDLDQVMSLNITCLFSTGETLCCLHVVLGFFYAFRFRHHHNFHHHCHHYGHYDHEYHFQLQPSSHLLDPAIRIQPQALAWSPGLQRSLLWCALLLSVAAPLAESTPTSCR